MGNGSISRAQFDLFRKSTIVEIEELKKEIESLKEKLEKNEKSSSSCMKEKNETSSQPKETKSDGEKKENQSWYKAEKIESITYQQAWESLGGDTELAKYKDQSAKIQRTVVDSVLEQEISSLLPGHYSDRKSYSTSLVNQRYVQSLEELYIRANQVFPQFDAVIKELASRTDGKAIVPPVKGAVRARMKALFKYRDDQSEDDTDASVAWYRLTDLVRGTLQYNTISQLYTSLEALIEHFGAENILEVNDRYHNPLAGGYRDIQCSIKFQDHVCELQLNTEPMLRAKMTTGHRDFEVVRELKAAVTAGDLLRVMNALEFGSEHLGSDRLDGDQVSSPLKRLIRSKSANTLLHEAASKGNANIIHALLLYGADPDVQNKDGDTPLHIAVFGGYEPCVWVLLDVGQSDLTLKNNDGQTALVKGYLLTWMRPSEVAIRAVTTLAHSAGADAVKEARTVIQHHIKKMQYNSSQLVDYANNGRVEDMMEELRNFADPNSTRDGHSAMLKAILNYHIDAVKLLFDFKARVDINLLISLPSKQFRTDPRMQEIMRYVCELGKVPHVKVTNGFWSTGIIGMIALEEGTNYQSDRAYVWSNVPFELQGIPMTYNNCHSGRGLELSVTPYGKTIGILIAHGVKEEYNVEADVRNLIELGFTKLTLPSMRSSSFKHTIGADLWQLSSPSSDDVDSDPIILEMKEDFELNICLLPKPIAIEFEIKATAGAWKINNNDACLKVSRLVNDVVQYTDRNYTWLNIPLELNNIPMSVNPCHTGCGLMVQISNLFSTDASIGILIAKGAKNEYSAGYQSLYETLNCEGYVKTYYSEMYSTSYPTSKGAELWTLPIKGFSSVNLSTVNDIEINILFFSQGVVTGQ